MAELRQDLRAHPVAAWSLLALWVGAGWLVAAMGLSNCGFFLLLLPPVATGFAIGRSRRLREAPSSGIIAALIIGVLLLDLSLAAIILAGRGGEPEPFVSWWATLFEAAFWIALADLFGLMAGAGGWLVGHEAVYPEEEASPVG